MSKINYIIGEESLLDYIEPLWLKLNEIHFCRSPYFKVIYKGRPFSERKTDLIDKAKKGKLAVAIAKTNNDELIGYCVSSVVDNIGEIESIYIDENYRMQGVGYNLMEILLNWIDGYHPNKIIVSVSVGNEEVFPFYEKFGFYPHLVELQKASK